MNRVSDSLQINESLDFILDQSKNKIDRHSQINRNTVDDLEYSVDEISNDTILGEFVKNSQYTPRNQVYPIEKRAVAEKEQEKKRERKAIFDKPSQRNIGGVGSAGNQDVAGNTLTAMTQNQPIYSKIPEQVEAFQKNPPLPNKMVSPPHILVMPSNQPVAPQNRVSYQSVGDRDSFVINNSMTAGGIGSGNYPFANSRTSQKMQLPQDIFNSRTSYFNANSVLTNVNANSNILDQLKMSEIKLKPDNNILLSGIHLVESQGPVQISGLRQHPDYINVPTTYQPPVLSRVSQQQLQVENPHPSEIKIQSHISQDQFQKPTPTSNIHPALILPQLLEDKSINASQISIHSNLKSSTSSNLMSSDSLNRALGNLEEHSFLEPTIQSRMPQLLQESNRLNSISINFNSPTLALDSIRHKEIIRNLIFEQLTATQILQRLQGELEAREMKHKSLVRQFNVNTFMEGQWYELKVRNDVIRPKQSPAKRSIDFNLIKQTLKNSTDVLRYFQNYVQHMKIEGTEQFKRTYIQIRSSLYQIFNNLKKVSQDLFVKSTTQYIPQHYYRFYEHIRSPVQQFGTISEMNKKIEEKQKILLQINYLRNEHDPLACSKVAEELEGKIKNDLNVLRSAYINGKRGDK